MDQTLNFNLYLKQIIKIVSYKVSLLTKLRKYITTSSAIQIYKSMIIPYLDYSDVLFNHGSTKLLDKLQKLQKRGFRLCFGRQVQLSVDNMHTEANVMFLKNRRELQVCTFMFKQQTNNSILGVQDIRTKAHDAVLFNTKQPSCTNYMHNIYYYGARSWNQLPVNERKIVDYDSKLYKAGKPFFEHCLSYTCT